MSRSRHSHNHKGPGYEYWSRRPGSHTNATSPGRSSKKINARLERIQDKQEIQKQLREYEDGKDNT